MGDLDLTEQLRRDEEFHIVGGHKVKMPFTSELYPVTGTTVVQSPVEVRIIDPKTGGEKGEKEDRYDLIPPEFEAELAAHYGRGSKKYADRNWEKGYKWHLSYRALRSHLNSWQRGESYDKETGTHHLICVAWHACALYIYELRGLGTDDVRAKK